MATTRKPREGAVCVWSAIVGTPLSAAAGAGCGSIVASVVVPAFNSVEWIGDALASIRSQTLPDIEIIVVDDASTDGTADVVQSMDDSRIRLIRLEQNVGAAAARMQAIDAALGEFVALMDSDDVALPHWLERQVKFLRSNPSCALVGAWIKAFGARDGIWTASETHEHIKADLLFRCAMNQNTIVFRREQFRVSGLRYDAKLPVAEDYDLWTRCADIIRMHNTQEVLVQYRIHALNCTVTRKPLVRQISRDIRARQLGKLGLDPSEQELDLHDALGDYGPSGPRERVFDIDALERWLIKLHRANAVSSYVPGNVLSVLLYEFWRRCCKPQGAVMSVPVLRFLQSELAAPVSPVRKVKDIVKMVAGGHLYSLPRGTELATSEPKFS